MFSKQTHTIKVGTSTLHYSVIPWDSTYLSNTTVEIEDYSATSKADLVKLMARLELSLHLKKGDLLFSKIPLKDFRKIRLLDESGFYCMEQTITLDINLSMWDPDRFGFPMDESYQFIPALPSDKKAICRIARTTFTADRFHMDPLIPKAGADFRFEMWIENSFRSKDSVYKFADKKGKIISFFIYRAHKDHAEFRLAGLDPEYIGKGLGKMLYHHMYRELKKQSYTKVLSVISLNNLPVLNVYMYLGCAKFFDPLITLHKVITSQPEHTSTPS